MCLRAIKTKHYSYSAYLSSVSWAIYNIDLYFKQTIQFPKPTTRAANLTTAPSGQRSCYATGWL